MPQFTYVARNLEGQRITGNMSAASERDVVQSLSVQSLFPVSVAPRQAADGATFRRGVGAQAIATFYAQLASLLRNGVPLLKSLKVLQQQSSSARLRAILDDVITRVEDGMSLGDAFSRHPKVFNEIAVNMARAGSEGGFLEDALDRVAQFTEQQSDLRARTIGALIYPLVLAVAGTVILIGLVVFFVPIFAQLFDTMRERGDLPVMTDLLLQTSGVARQFGPFALAFFAILFLVLRVPLGSERGRRWRDGVKLRLPLFGSIFLSLAAARFCRVLGTLLHNGVPILKSLEISRHAAGNRVLADAIGAASENVTAGEPLAVPLAKSGHFPASVTEMISVAEESNTLDTVLVNIADSLERQTARRLELMVRMLEPAMLMVMAGVILVIVISLLMPVIKMGTAIQ